MEEEKAAEKEGRQMKQHQLDFKTVVEPHEFTKGGVLTAVTKLIATNNKVGY